ncbi:phosphoinositide phospholipase C 2-like [Sesamum indicum]|uniref:Phosphoinositide phospholipase C n=1 Tax=Sesamum indicum TaxID=4182 RepID=A0A6I9T3Q8_SESIN|nr:phosphoinositide phospholipase C 2-like [Sesamum indicum]
MSKQTYRVCFCFRRRFRLAASEAPADVKEIFARYSDNGVMSVDQLRRFLVEVQGEENATLEDAQSLMDSLKHLNIFHRRGFNLETFFKYLFGDVNPPLNPKLGVHHDMNAPLSHYFIYTGHNSYLTGNQLSSDCSDVPIINALHRGVRVIELDIWPNSRNDDVNVLHGRTLTTPVQLIKCLKSIKEHAFVASEYPVVITLEDHLTPDLQAKVAEMITQTFGDILFSPGSECLREFPSPESLKRRIIISTKPPKEYLQAKDVKVQENDSKKEKDSNGREAWGSELKGFEAKMDDDKDYGDFDVEDDEDDGEDLKAQQNEAPEYRRLIAIHAGKGKGGMKDWLKVDPDKVRRLSLSEQELEKAIITYGKDIVRFTQRNLLRVYPKGIRFDSSNYNPLIGWSHGAQMVAFNMQGYGRSLWLMHGMFKANGGCGYVKKPEFLLQADSNGNVFDPKAILPVKTTLRVTVYMGEGWYYDFKHTHFDAYSPPDFYARVGIAGVPADTVMKKTKTLEDNWIPTWDEVFEFPLTVPELALLRIEVHEYDMSEKDDFAGQTCLPVRELRQGIRAVPLHSRKGEKYNSVKLLMRFEFV